MFSLFRNRLLVQMLIGAVTLGIFIVIVIYIFNHASPRVAEAQVTDVFMARAIDTQGNPVGISQRFDTKRDTAVYAIVDLKNATKKTQIAYVRYLNGKYADSKITVPSKDNVEKVFFSFEKGVGQYPPGSYTLVTYVDGRRAAQTQYTYGANVAQSTATAGIGPTNLAAAVALAAPMGKVAFVLKGTVITSSATSLTLHVLNTSKNMLAIKNSTQVLPITKKTRITKNTHSVASGMLTVGTTVYVYGIFDKKTSHYLSIGWLRLQ